MGKSLGARFFMAHCVLAIKSSFCLANYVLK